MLIQLETYQIRPAGVSLSVFCAAEIKRDEARCHQSMNDFATTPETWVYMPMVLYVLFLFFQGVNTQISIFSGTRRSRSAHAHALGTRTGSADLIHTQIFLLSSYKKSALTSHECERNKPHVFVRHVCLLKAHSEGGQVWDPHPIQFTWTSFCRCWSLKNHSKTQ